VIADLTAGDHAVQAGRRARRWRGRRPRT
jgi:hypothetical protein